MAKKKKKRSQNKTSPTPQVKKKDTVADRREAYSKAVFDAMSKVQVRDIDKTTTVTYADFSKDKFRKYIKNPKSNESSIREMSQFLYRVSMPYKRLLSYYTNIPMFYWNLTPIIDQSKNYNSKKVLKAYCEMVQELNRMNIANEMRKVIKLSMRDGVYYGFIYEDKSTFFIQTLDPDYCKIVEIEDGCYNFAFDFNYFKKNKTQLEYMDPYFKSCYQAYDNDNNLRWQILDNERTICIKADYENIDEVLPSFVGVFEALIDLIDSRSLQRNKDAIENYKMIVQKLPRFSDTKEVDDFSIEMDTALSFYRKMMDVVPENVGVALSPMDTDTINFKSDMDADTLISNYTKSVFDDSGTSQMLFNSDKSGSVGLDASIKTDVSFVWEIVESVQRWIKRFVAYKSKSQKFDFEILPVTIFNKDKAIETEKNLASLGVPNKMKLAATAGLNPLDTISNQIFENEILDLTSKWIPLQSSYTMTDNQGGRPTTDNPTDETEKSRDGEKNKDVLDG